MFEINGEHWKVLMVNEYHPMLKRSDGSYTIGSCDDTNKAIYLNENLNKQRLKRVLCHEITHAAMFSYNVDLTIDQEELLADLLGTYGHEIISITNKIFLELRKSKKGIKR